MYYTSSGHTMNMTPTLITACISHYLPLLRSHKSETTDAGHAISSLEFTDSLHFLWSFSRCLLWHQRRTFEYSDA